MRISKETSFDRRPEVHTPEGETPKFKNIISMPMRDWRFVIEIRVFWQTIPDLKRLIINF